ncbi:MAG: hypothetical protein ACJ75R_03435 [Solirubrobacterales bacterium]
MARKYGAFISYRRDEDSKLAAALQRGIERFGRGWREGRPVRVFRDDASLSANPGLWSSIEDALEASGWFVLLASPEAAESKWVNRELEWWLGHHRADQILLVLTAGDIVWGADDFDPELTTALPPVLHGAFNEEPRYVDARWSRTQELISDANPQLRDAVADVAATVRGIPKDELVGEAVRQQHRTRRIIRGVVAGFVVLFAAVAAAAVVALNQRSAAKNEARTSLSRQLAALSDNLQSTDLDAAMLLAVQAYETEPSSDTRGALIRADTASPALARYVNFDGPVTALATSPDGDFAAVGLGDGSVLRVSLTDANPASEQVLSLDDEVSSLGVSDGGTTIAASDGKRAMLWASELPDGTELAVAADQDADRVAVSPSGATVAVNGDAGYNRPGSVSLYSGRSGSLAGSHRIGRGLSAVWSLQFPTDGELGIASYGGWQERRIADWHVLWSRTILFGAHEAAGVPSADGRWISATNGAGTVPVWATRASGDRDPPERTAEVSLSGFPNALAIGPTGRELAIADSGVIYVAPLAPPGSNRGETVSLRGAGVSGTTGTNLIRFAGDGRHLVSAAGDAIAVWDLDQLDRLAAVSRFPLGAGCNGCGVPRMAVSPTGDQLAVSTDGSAAPGASAVIERLDDATPAAQTLPVNSYAGPAWIDGGSIVAFPLTGGGGTHAVPGQARVWGGGTSRDEAVVAAPGADQGSVVTVDDRGTVLVRDGESGDAFRRIAGPEELASGTDTLTDAAVDQSGQVVARLYGDVLTITDLDSGELVGRPPAADATHVRYAGEHLLIQHQNGTLEVWDRLGSSRERVLPGDETLIAAPTGSPDGALVARPHTNGEITIADLRDGATLGVVRVPEALAGLIKSAVGFGPDGNTLITVTESYDPEGSYLVLRDLSPPSLIETACRSAGRALTVDEWERLVGVEAPEQLACADN